MLSEQAGPQRSRILGTLYKDERVRSMGGHFDILEKMYMERLLRRKAIRSRSALAARPKSVPLGKKLTKQIVRGSFSTTTISREVEFWLGSRLFGSDTGKEVSVFEASLAKHQKALLSDGSTVLDRAVIEHNMLARRLLDRRAPEL